MQQPQRLGNLIRVKEHLPTVSWYQTPKNLSVTLRRRGEIVIRKFGSDDDFKRTVNPDTQINFGKNPTAAVMGDYPTLTDINIAYGDGFATEWLLPHLARLSLFVGAKNLDINQERELAAVIAEEYHYLKVTEILLFLYRFRTGRYGRFYGAVDPMVITCALRDFMVERNEIIAANTPADPQTEASRPSPGECPNIERLVNG